MDNPTFNVGDNVKIVGGTFDGFGGPIITPEEATAMPHSVATTELEEGALWIAVSIFGRNDPIQQSPERLCPA
jgi:transcription antitermination factor NusG